MQFAAFPACVSIYQGDSDILADIARSIPALPPLGVSCGKEQYESGAYFYFETNIYRMKKTFHFIFHVSFPKERG